MSPELEPNPNYNAAKLYEILKLFADRRVVVVGTTCSGKSTLQQQIPGTLDMDKLIFPLLTEQERTFVCQDQWTEEIGEFMTEVTRQRVNIEPGKPLFGTVVLDADVIVHITISDQLLQERTAMRNVSFENAKNMQAQLEQNIVRAGVPVVHFCVD